MYIYIHIYTLYHHHPLKRGRTQNVSYMFQGVFEGGLENVSLHFEGILTTLPTKTIPGGRSVTKFTFKGGSQKMYLTFYHFGMVPLKSSLKGLVIIYLHVYIYMGVSENGDHIWVNDITDLKYCPLE